MLCVKGIFLQKGGKKKNMQHHFDVEIAEKYGVLEAVILNNMQFWIKHNEANQTNFYDGYYWTYNSTKAFAEIFPYASEKQIRKALTHLIDEGILITGNYNKLSFDRTLWYTITEKGKCIFPVGQMEMTKKSNGNDLEGEPIPNINTNINSNDNKKERKKQTYEDIISQYVKNEDVILAVYDFIKMRKMIKKPLTDRALHMILKKLVGFSNDPQEQVKILENSINGCWQNIYALKDKPKTNKVDDEYLNSLG